MLEIAYYGGLRVSELVSLTWGQVINRDSGEAQLEIVGKGRKTRQVLIPLPIATRLLASRGGQSASAPVFESVRNPGHALTERAVNFIVKAAASALASTRVRLCIGCGMRTPATPSTTAHPSRWCRPHLAMPT